MLKEFKLPAKKANLTQWRRLVDKRLKKKNKTANIAIVGKYFGTGDSNLTDAYYALIEAIKHGGLENDTAINFNFINSDKQENEVEAMLEDANGIVVPIGWGSRGVHGKIKAIKYARENKIPYIGLCYGMQLACIEYARNVAGMKNADTEENNPTAEHQIIHSIPFDPKYQIIKGDGCSMRLGTFPCILKANTQTYKIYDKHNAFADKSNSIVEERHRHRFEFNNEYRQRLEKAGLVISGVSPDNMFVEFIELPRKTHPFFIATQGHPEYKSTPLNPHPLFVEFIKASLNYRN